LRKDCEVDYNQRLTKAVGMANYYYITIYLPSET